MHIGKNLKKGLERAVLIFLNNRGYSFFLLAFFTTYFMHPFIKYSGPIVGMNGMIYYKEPTNIIASDVLGFDEVRGKYII